MLQNTRQAQIIDLLRQDSVVLVKTLTAQLDVSESTIRRDLEQLEQQRYLRRVHGGAVLETDQRLANDPSVKEPPFEVRQVSHEQQKDRIGRLAAEWVSDNDVIFVDGGTSTSFIVPYLVERQGLTVVTCGLNVVMALEPYSHIATIVIGGELHRESHTFTGVMALEALDRYIRCDKAFIACGGAAAKYGVTNRILNRISLKRKAMEHSRQVGVLADSSKIGLATLGFVAPITSFDLVFTDDGAPQQELLDMAAQGVEVRTPSQRYAPNRDMQN